MAVQCLNQIEKRAIYDSFKDGASKRSLAKKYEVSDKTIKRVIDEIESESETTVVGTNEPEPQEQTETVEEKTVDSSLEGVHFNFTLCSDSISITHMLNGEMVSHNIDENHEKFEWAYGLIMESRGSQESLREVVEEVSTKVKLEALTFGRLKVEPEIGEMTYTFDDGYVHQFHGRLLERVVDSVVSGNESKLNSLVNFSKLLMENPSNRSVNELYNFLDHNCIQIDEEGMVIAFKKVRENFTDVHSGKFDNSIGSKPRVNRNQVDEDSQVTCSYGLHVCASSYLSSFGGTKTVKVKVHPKDFVAIPRDYKNAKARVCGYEVIDEVTNW